METKKEEKTSIILKNHNILYYFLGLSFLLFCVFVLAFIHFFNNFYYTYIIIISLFQIYLLFFCYFFISIKIGVIKIDNEKIYSIEKFGFLDYKLIKKNISEIVNIKAKKKGILGNFFGFGEINILFSNSNLKLKYCLDILDNAEKLNKLCNKN